MLCFTLKNKQTNHTTPGQQCKLQNQKTGFLYIEAYAILISEKKKFPAAPSDFSKSSELVLSVCVYIHTNTHGPNISLYLYGALLKVSYNIF